MDLIPFYKRFSCYPAILLGAPIHGVGKSTVAKEVKKLTNWPILSAGEIFRELAEEKGLDVDDYSKYLAEHPDENRFVNKEIERLLISRARELQKESPVIVDGNLAIFYPLEHALRVVIVAPIDIVVERALRARKVAESYRDSREALLLLVARTITDALQYLEIDDELYIKGGKGLLHLLALYLRREPIPYPTIVNDGAPADAAKKLLALLDDWVKAKMVG